MRIILLCIVVFLALTGCADRNIILLSFDVEPVDGAENVYEVMGALQAHNVTATFFVTGAYAEEYPDVVRNISLRGFEVGVHGFSHNAFPTLTSTEKLEELRYTKILLENLTGEAVVGFRAPYNRIDRETYELLEQEAYWYDASPIDGWELIYPDVLLPVVPVSSVFHVPLEDVVFLYYLRVPASLYVEVMALNKGMSSLLFHPHHTVSMLDELDSYILEKHQGGSIFITHKQYVQMSSTH